VPPPVARNRTLRGVRCDRSCDSHYLQNPRNFCSNHPRRVIGTQPSYQPTLRLEGYHESRRCSRCTYPESYITKYTSIRRKPPIPENGSAYTRKRIRADSCARGCCEDFSRRCARASIPSRFSLPRCRFPNPKPETGYRVPEARSTEPEPRNGRVPSCARNPRSGMV